MGCMYLVLKTEGGQPFGNRAKQFVLEAAGKKTVRVVAGETDRYGRLIGEVFLPDGRSLNRELVREGYAWWYQRYSRDQSLGELEAQARRERRGLWRDPQPLAPWEWRAASRGQSASASSQTPSALSSEPYRGNVRSQVFHQAGCKDYEFDVLPRLKSGDSWEHRPYP